MIIAICILSALLIISLWIVACLWYAINILIDKYIESNPEQMLKYFYEKYAEEELPCTLLLTKNNNADFDGSIYDLSLYEEKNIIGLIECEKKTASEDECEEDEEPMVLLPN